LRSKSTSTSAVAMEKWSIQSRADDAVRLSRHCVVKKQTIAALMENQFHTLRDCLLAWFSFYGKVVVYNAWQKNGKCSWSGDHHPHCLDARLFRETDRSTRQCPIYCFPFEHLMFYCPGKGKQSTRNFFFVEQAL